MTNPLLSILKEKEVPDLYTQEGRADPTIYLEISTLGSCWRWFVAEARIEEDDVLFFGYVAGHDTEFGYFRFSEMKNARIPLIVDYGFEVRPLSAVKRDYELE